MICLVVPDYACAYYAFEIAYNAYEQCSKISPIMLQLCPVVPHYAQNMFVENCILTVLV